MKQVLGKEFFARFLTWHLTWQNSMPKTRKQKQFEFETTLKNQVIQAVPKLHPLVGGHVTSPLPKGSRFHSPSQKGHLPWITRQEKATHFTDPVFQLRAVSHWGKFHFWVLIGFQGPGAQIGIYVPKKHNDTIMVKVLLWSVRNLIACYLEPWFQPENQWMDGNGDFQAFFIKI